MTCHRCALVPTGGPCLCRCLITVYRSENGRWGTQIRHVPCDAPVVRNGFCATHADDHERLCEGCGRCS